MDPAEPDFWAQSRLNCLWLMVPLDREEHPVNSADDERAALARLESDLAGSDPDFDRRIRLATDLLRRQRPPLAAASVVLFIAGVVLVALAVTAQAGWPLLFVGAVLLATAAAAGYPAYRFAHHARDPSRHRPRWRTAAAAFAQLARPPRNEDDIVLDPVGAVIVGCDGEPRSDAALRYAAAEARRRGTSLLVVIAFAEPIDPDNDEFDTPPETQRARARARAAQALARAVPDPPAHQIVAIAGLPGRVLRDQFPHAALIVIGARHRHLLAPLTSAESAEHLLAARGHVPVVVVPPAWDS